MVGEPGRSMATSFFGLRSLLALRIVDESASTNLLGFLAIVLGGVGDDGCEIGTRFPGEECSEMPSTRGSSGSDMETRGTRGGFSSVIPTALASARLRGSTSCDALVTADEAG